VHGRAAHSPLLHGLPELQHAQAFAGVPVLLLEHGLRLLLAVLTQTCDQGRGFLLLHLAVAVLVRLQEELVSAGLELLRSLQWGGLCTRFLLRLLLQEEAVVVVAAASVAAAEGGRAMLPIGRAAAAHAVVMMIHMAALDPCRAALAAMDLGGTRAEV